MAYVDSSDPYNRFEQARARYRDSQRMLRKRETLAEDPNIGNEGVTNFLDYLEKRQRDLPKPVNITKPIPVSIVKADSNILPFKGMGALSDLENIANETTLQKVLHVLTEIFVRLKTVVENIVEQFSLVGNNLSRDLRGMLTGEEEKSKGWFTKIVSGIRNQFKDMPGVGKAIDKSNTLFAAMTENSKKTIDHLKGIYRVLAEGRPSATEGSRDLIEEQKSSKTGAFAGMYDVFFEKDGKLDKTFKMFGKLGEGLNKLGEWGEKQSQGIMSTGLGVFLGNNLGNIMTKATGLFRIFGGLGKFITRFVGGALFASVYALFKNPDQMAGMLGMFARLFTDVIMPVFVWINKEIVPVLTVAFAGLTWILDKVTDTFGSLINNTIISLGNIAIDVAMFFGRQIDHIWQSLKDIILRIAGIFGVGKYGDEGIIKNFIGIFTSMFDGIMEYISIWATEIIKSLGLSDFFGLKEGEGIWGRIKRFFMVDLPEWAIAQFNKLTDYLGISDWFGFGGTDNDSSTIAGSIKGFFKDKIPNWITESFNKLAELVSEYNPYNLIKDKISSFIDAIVNLVPSWADVKSWVKDAIPNWVPDRLKNWFDDQLSGSGDAVKQQAAEAYNKISPTVERAYDRTAPVRQFLSERSERLLNGVRDRSSVIFAPTTITDMSNKVNSVTQQGKNIIGSAIGHTKPILDDWANSTYNLR